jgi:hypothetical protein
MTDYSALAKKYGGTTEAPTVDYTALAKQFGGQTASAEANPVNKDYQAGANAPGALRGLLSVANGPTMGFGDEIMGGVGGLYDTVVKGGNLSDNYKANRDYVRGAQDVEAQTNPIVTALTQTAASAPLLVYNGVGALGAKIAPRIAESSNLFMRMLKAGSTGAAYGTVQGAGNSTAEDAGGVLKDAAVSGVASGALGSAAVPVASVIGAAGRNVAQRVSTSSAADYAREKVAESLARDARGNVVQSGASNSIQQAAARFTKLGDEATVADAAGRNTNQLLDTLATLPGKTKDSAEQLIHSRQAGRAGRLIASAEENLGTQGQRLSPHLDRWAADRATASAPIYNQLRQINVQPSNDLRSVVQAADDLGALGEARKMATANQQRFGLDPAYPQAWNMGDLDHVKQGLDQLIAKQWNAAEGKLTPLGASYQGLKNRLTTELDSATTDPKTGASVYKAARDAYAGPSAIIDAAQQGRLALSKDGSAISNLTSDLSDSEMQAFRLGAFESLRNKLGKEGGQTEILKMWKEPATREKLQAVFGDETAFRQFSADVAKEARLKSLESVGRGSQTAARQYGAGDLDMSALTDAGGAVAAAKTGNALSALGSAKSAWNRVATPQLVRDQMGEILLSKGAEGRQNINALTAAAQNISRRNANVNRGSGLAGSLIGSRLATPIPVSQR